MKSETTYLTEADRGLQAPLVTSDGDSSVNSVLAEFLGLVVRLTGARAGAIRAPTTDCSQLRLVASVGLSSEVCARDAVMPANCGICGAALQSALTRQATRQSFKSYSLQNT